MAEDSLYDQLGALFQSEQLTITDEVKKCEKKHANKLKNRIRQDSPKRDSKEKYAKGWVAEVTHESAVDLAMVVRNKAEPTLPHLLEKSHKIIVRKGKNGGYVMVDSGKETKPHPHILDNANAEIEAFWNDLAKGGGSK